MQSPQDDTAQIAFIAIYVLGGPLSLVRRQQEKREQYYTRVKEAMEAKDLLRGLPTAEQAIGL